MSNGEKDKREPLFDSAAMVHTINFDGSGFFDDHPSPIEAYQRAVKDCEAIIEAKITSGELITKEQAEAMVQKAVNEYAQDRANDEA
jgi:hypothetical protein